MTGLRSIVGGAVCVGVSILLSACSGSANPAGPSALGVTSGHSGGTNRHYTAAIAPATATAGATTSFTVTFTNCNETLCPGDGTSANQDIGSAEIAIPAGFAVSTVTNLGAPAGTSWSWAIVADTIRLGANGGGSRLEAGESLTVTFSATVPSNCMMHPWATRAFQDTLASGSLVTTTPYLIVGTRPEVEVTGCGTTCTLGQGYWKNHPEAWPVTSLTLGSVAYSQAQLLAILNESVGGNGLISLSHQLIAAKLNAANGADTSAIAASIAAADTMVGSLVVPPVGAGWLAPATTGALNTTLTNYNEGVIGPGACPSGL